MVAGWNQPGCLAFAVALGLSIAADVITYAFHYPRLALMFKSATPVDPARLARAAHEWAAGNWVRGILLVVVLLALLSGQLQLATRSAG